MAPKRKSAAQPKPQRRVLNPTHSSAFVSLSLGSVLLEQFGNSDTQVEHDSSRKQNLLREEGYRAQTTQNPPAVLPPITEPEDTAKSEHPEEPEVSFERPGEPGGSRANADLQAEMKTRGAWDQNLANPHNPANRLASVINSDSASPLAPRKHVSVSVSRSPSVKPGLSRANTNRQTTPRVTVASGRVHKSTPDPAKRKAKRRTPFKRESSNFGHHVDHVEDEEEELEDLNDGADKENEHHADSPPTPPTLTSDSSDDITMAAPERPTLKLKMSTLGGAGAQPAMQPLATPVPQSATQRIKLSFSRKPSLMGEIKKEESPELGSAAKKRKRELTAVDADDDGAPPARKPSMGPRKLTLKTKAPPLQTPASAVTPHVKFHVKGKAPPRKLGMGYDSENDESERDPVILDGFILRMLPGPDCDYVQDAIKNNTIGLSKLQGGASISIRMIDTQGKRGILSVRDKKYATTLVNLPCIIEGMKSWDRKSFVKSIDICQMLLVLGPCKNDDEARHYPLPPDVNPVTQQYAHGITPPMHHVRKRRFDKTPRTKVDDIEAIERRVQALLDEDDKAINSSYEVLDYDPGEDQDQYSSSETDQDEDTDGEAEPEDYFGQQPDHIGTPLYANTPQQIDGEEEEDDDDIDIDADFAKEVEEQQQRERENKGKEPAARHLVPGLSGAEDSSVAVTSTSVSPSASINVTAAQTPASGGAGTSDDEGDDDMDDDAADDDDDKSESGNEDNENLQQTKDRIAELEEKIKEQKAILIKTQNAILRRKIATKIGELEKDVGMMRRGIGLGDADEEGGEN